jgi:rhamnosyltransferase
MRKVAGIVTYWPELESLLRLVETLARATERVLIFANSPLALAERDRLRACNGEIEIFESPENVGLGHAYNHLMRRARECGADAILLVDQDSALTPSAVSEIADRMGALGAAGNRVAVVGARPVQPRKTRTRFKATRLFARRSRTGLPGAMAVDFVVSSGSLVSLSAYEAVGPFREDFFIDAIDIEWCFRAWHKGYSCWAALGAPMEHHLGEGVLKVPLTGVTLTLQQPQRLYTYVRNQVRMLGLRHVPLRWKMRILPYIGLQTAVYAVKGENRRDALSAIGRGFRDGLVLAVSKPGGGLSPSTAPLSGRR